MQVNTFDDARLQSYQSLADAQSAWDFARANRYLGPPELWGEEPADEVVVRQRTPPLDILPAPERRPVLHQSSGVTLQRADPQRSIQSLEMHIFSGQGQTASITLSSDTTSWMTSSIIVSADPARYLTSPPPYQPHLPSVPSNHTGSFRPASPPPYHLYSPPVSSSYAPLPLASSNHRLSSSSPLSSATNPSPGLAHPHTRPLSFPSLSLSPPSVIDSPALQVGQPLASPSTNSEVWYIVVMGAHPGVYLGR